ncbi:hypothetical protein LCL89_12790 [Halobacillus yeomjeoni]|uniref:Uncharacterized protein n=1 Tax=Halobacillus yeomjeoni TaxID=311194 RepID=A0A931MVB9_9BACI|nr:hypothetical protein [Halobacillus yeomjeoni]MBH0230221.1 hypothetical protein [Halobacillus yeomjeoni]MCA0984924.1 hypothetical protein [Halobacillus yeomjeoni]
MDLKERLISHGYDHIDILIIDEESNQTTVPDITLHKVSELEYKLYLIPETIHYHLEDENPYFEAEQRNELGEPKKIKGFVLEW